MRISSKGLLVVLVLGLAATLPQRAQAQGFGDNEDVPTWYVGDMWGGMRTLNFVVNAQLALPPEERARGEK